MKAKPEVREQTQTTGPGEQSTRPLRLMGFIGSWAMVRRDDFPGAMPFVISKREWDTLPIV